MEPSFGSGAKLLGAPASAIMGMPGTLAQSPSSPSFTPGTLPPPPMSAPQAPQSFQSAPSMPPLPGSAPVPNQMPQAPQAPVGVQTAIPTNPVGMPPGNPEALAIVKALTSRLSSVSKAEELQHNLTGQL